MDTSQAVKGMNFGFIQRIIDSYKPIPEDQGWDFKPRFMLCLRWILTIVGFIALQVVLWFVVSTYVMSVFYALIVEAAAIVYSSYSIRHGYKKAVRKHDMYEFWAWAIGPILVTIATTVGLIAVILIA